MQKIRLWFVDAWSAEISRVSRSIFVCTGYAIVRPVRVQGPDPDPNSSDSKSHIAQRTARQSKDEIEIVYVWITMNKWIWVWYYDLCRWQSWRTSSWSDFMTFWFPFVECSRTSISMTNKIRWPSVASVCSRRDLEERRQWHDDRCFRFKIESLRM